MVESRNERLRGRQQVSERECERERGRESERKRKKSSDNSGTSRIEPRSQDLIMSVKNQEIRT